MTTKNLIKELIKKKLKERKIKQIHIAKEFNTTVSNVNNVICGRSNSKILRTIIAQKLNMSVDDIWGPPLENSIEYVSKKNTL